jgi:hypothetical protein
MNGEEKLRTVLTKTGIPTYEWPSLNGQVSKPIVYTQADVIVVDREHRRAIGRP